MPIVRHHFRIALLACSLAVAAIAGACSDAARSASETGTTTAPPPPPPPPAKPTIVLSTDSVVASAVNGAGVLSYDITVTPGDTTKLHALAVVAGSFGDGDTGAWLSAQLDTASAPAKLSIHVDPAHTTVGVHNGVLTVSAQTADSKSVRVRVDVRPHPILLADSVSRSVTAQLGDSVPVATVALRSSSDTISKLSLATPDCGTRQWLSAKLSSETTPAVVTLSFDTHDLAAGSFECRVRVQSSQALVDSASRTIVVSLTLRQSPRIALDGSATASIGANSGTDANPVRFQITNAGTGTLDGLSVGDIDYGGGASGWLTATLDRTVAPATLTLASTARSLPGGTFKATVPILSSAAGVANSPTLVTMILVVAPKVFHFVISPTSVGLTYNNTTGQGNSVALSMFDGNASGQVASVARTTLTRTSSTGGCSSFQYLVPNVPVPVLPQTWVFSPVPVPFAGAAIAGSCTYLYSVFLSNGQSGSFTITVTVTP